MLLPLITTFKECSVTPSKVFLLPLIIQVLCMFHIYFPLLSEWNGTCFGMVLSILGFQRVGASSSPSLTPLSHHSSGTMNV